MRRDRRRPVGRGCRQRALDHQPAARRRNRDARPIAGGHARSDGDAHGILVVLQRADAGCIVVGEVVPRPPESQAVIVERVVVADDAAGDHAQSARLQLLGPRAEDVGRLADARIARADDDQVSLQDARVDASGRKHARLVRVIPAQALRGGGQRHDFHVRRGHHQPFGVDGIQRLAGFQRLDEHAPVAVRERRRRQQRVDVADEGRKGGRGRKGRRGRTGRMARGEQEPRTRSRAASMQRSSS